MYIYFIFFNQFKSPFLFELMTRRLEAGVLNYYTVSLGIKLVKEKIYKFRNCYCLFLKECLYNIEEVSHINFK